MTEFSASAGDPLRISDLVPLRRMLGTDSVVIRVNPDGTFAPFQRMPALFFQRSIRQALSDDLNDRFEKACSDAIAARRPVAFRPDESVGDEVLVNPILDNDRDECRFLVCWARTSDVIDHAAHVAWDDLRLDQVVTRYRTRSQADAIVIDAAPWWALTSGELLELWPHHTHVSAMGLGHAVMETLIMNAAEAAAEHVGGPAVRIAVPSADMLAALVPVFHGAVRASGLEPERVIVAIDVELAVDPDLLPIIVHLRTMGMQIDLVGLDALTATLHTVSDTSSHTHPVDPRQAAILGGWTDTFAAAIVEPT